MLSTAQVDSCGLSWMRKPKKPVIPLASIFSNPVRDIKEALLEIIRSPSMEVMASNPVRDDKEVLP